MTARISDHVARFVETKQALGDWSFCFTNY